MIFSLSGGTFKGKFWGCSQRGIKCHIWPEGLLTALVHASLHHLSRVPTHPQHTPLPRWGQLLWAAALSLATSSKSPDASRGLWLVPDSPSPRKETTCIQGWPRTVLMPSNFRFSLVGPEKGTLT